MTIDFVTQFLKGFTGSMILPRYATWSALAALAIATSKRVWINQEHYQIFPNLYIVLVGPMGSRKSTPMEKVWKMIRTCFPAQCFGSSIASRESIIKEMSSDDCADMYKFDGKLLELRSYALFIDEIANFFSFNPGSMVAFLTNIYSTPRFKSSTIVRGVEDIENPCMNLLGCTTPEYITGSLKRHLLEGGIARRIIFVNEILEVERNAFPEKTEESKLADLWCMEHLKKVRLQVGPLSFTIEAKFFLQDWYQSQPKHGDLVMKGFWNNSDILAQKIAILLTLAKPDFPKFISRETVQTATQILTSVEQHLPLLTAASGGNRLAVVHQRLLGLLRENGGWMTEVHFHRIASQDLNEKEYIDVVTMFMKTNQMVADKVNGGVPAFFLPECYAAAVRARNERKLLANDSSAPSSSA